MNSPVLTALSFVQGGCLFQTHFMADTALRQRIQAALEADAESLSDCGAMDVQCYTPDFDGGSATSLAKDAFHAAGIRQTSDQTNPKNEAIEAVLQLATQMDTLSEGAGDATSWTAEWVWQNGGGEDNAFGQSFSVGPQAEQVARAFTHALEEVLSDEMATAPIYDFSVRQGIPEPESALEALNEALMIIDSDVDDSPEEGAPGNAPALKALAVALSQEPLPTPPRRVSKP